MADNSEIKLSEAEAKLLEKEKELEEDKKEISKEQQKIDQAEKKLEDALAQQKLDSESKMVELIEEESQEDTTQTEEIIENNEEAKTEQGMIEQSGSKEATQDEADKTNKGNEIKINPSEAKNFPPVLLLGGWKIVIINSISLYNSKEKRWQNFELSLPYGLQNHGSAYLGGQIYVFGGDNGNIDAPLENCFKLGFYNDWLKIEAMHERRTGITNSTIVVDNSIWVIGGSNGNEILKSVEKFSPSKNAWTSKPPLNVPRRYSAASIIDGKIYVSGGWNENGIIRSIEVFDPAKNQWEMFWQMPLDLTGHCSIVEGTNLIITGGLNSFGIPSDEVWKIDVLDTKKEWIKLPSLKHRRYLHGTIQLENGMMVFGGASNFDNRLESTEVFDGISWKEGPKLPEKYSAFSCIPLTPETEKALLRKLA